MSKNKYSKFKIVDCVEDPRNTVSSIYQVAVNDAYIVQFSKTKCGLLDDNSDLIMDHLWIQTRDEIGKDIPWSEKFRIKEEFYPGRWATEMYPSKEHLVDNANIYHLYVWPEGMSFSCGLHIFHLEIDKDKVVK
jgi:hypothetical protein